MKKYKTLIELPDAPIGTPVVWNESSSRYYLNGNVQANSYSRGTVETNPSWFAPIPSHPTKEEIIESHGITPEQFYPDWIYKAFHDTSLKIIQEFESSLKEQLIEKIESSQIFIFKETITVDEFMTKMKSEILSIIKDLKE